MSNVNAVTFTIVVVLFLVVTLTGFAAARWRRAEDMLHLNEWGLGGRGFGTFVAWFLLGGDLSRRAVLRHVHHVVPAGR